MPQTKLSDQEAAICSRIAAARTVLGLDQETFGAFVGLSRDRISSYENMRAPLRYSVADHICRTFKLNQRWLATGKAPQFFYVDIPKALAERVGPRDIFSTSFDTIIAEHVTSRMEFEAFALKCSVRDLGKYSPPDTRTVAEIFSRGGSPETLNMLPTLLAEVVKKGYQVVPHQLRWKFYADIGDAVTKFLEDHAAVIDRRRVPDASSRVATRKR